jgi:hypothetical protein
MPGSVTSVFSEAADFEAALREDGCLGMLVTGHVVNVEPASEMNRS